jgi:hypothetical protein
MSFSDSARQNASLGNGSGLFEPTHFEQMYPKAEELSGVKHLCRFAYGELCRSVQRV